MARLRIALTLTALVAVPTVAQAAFGDADTSWGIGGIGSVRIPNIAFPAPGPTTPLGARILGDGSIDLIAPTGDGARLVLSRLHYNSALTRTGLVRAGFGVSAFQLAQSTPYGGGFVSIGQVTTAAGNIAVVVRTTSTGALDRTFGKGGVAKLPAVQFTGSKMAVERAPGGFIVTSMGVTSPGSPTAAVRLNRLRPNGTLDTAFGTKGSVTIPVGDSDPGAEASLAVTGDNKIVLGVMGYYATGPQHDAILRRLPSGAPDTTFDSDGVSTRAPAGMAPYIADVVAQSDGKITVLATNYVASNGTPVLYRMKTNGQLDMAFGAAGGYVNLRPGTSTSARGRILIRRSDGRYVAALSSVAGTSGAAVGRTNANAQSATVTDVFAGMFPTAIAANGSKVVIGGQNSVGLQVTALADSDTTGAAATSTTDKAGGVTRATIQQGLTFPDTGGGVLIATQYASTLRIVALNSKGKPNQTFGPLAARGAIARGGVIGSGYLTMVRRLKDGRIAVTTNDFPTASHLLILKSDGSPDTSFQAGDLNLGPTTGVGDVVRLPDGRFLLAMGHFDSGLTAWVMRIVRLNSDGTYDSTFSGDGIVEMPYPAGTSQDTLPPGAIHVHATPAGYVAAGGSSASAVIARVSTAGVPDPTIGGGTGLTAIGPAGMHVFGASEDNLGRTVIVGLVGTKAVALRATTGLALDSSFSGDGVMSFTPPVGQARFVSVMALPDRSLVLEGLRTPSSGGIPTVEYTSVTARGAIVSRKLMFGRSFYGNLAVAPDGRFFTTTELPGIANDASVRRLKGLGPSRPLNARRKLGKTFSVSVDSRGLTLTTVQIQTRRAGRWVLIGRKTVPALVGRRTLKVLTSRRATDSTFRAVVVNTSGMSIGASFRG